MTRIMPRNEIDRNKINLFYDEIDKIADKEGQIL